MFCGVFSAFVPSVTLPSEKPPPLPTTPVPSIVTRSPQRLRRPLAHDDKGKRKHQRGKTTTGVVERNTAGRALPTVPSELRNMKKNMWRQRRKFTTHTKKRNAFYMKNFLLPPHPTLRIGGFRLSGEMLLFLMWVDTQMHYHLLW